MSIGSITPFIGVITPVTLLFARPIHESEKLRKIDGAKSSDSDLQQPYKASWFQHQLCLVDVILLMQKILHHKEFINPC